MRRHSIVIIHVLGTDETRIWFSVLAPLAEIVWIVVHPFRNRKASGRNRFSAPSTNTPIYNQTWTHRTPNSTLLFAKTSNLDLFLLKPAMQHLLSIRSTRPSPQNGFLILTIFAFLKLTTKTNSENCWARLNNKISRHPLLLSRITIIPLLLLPWLQRQEAKSYVPIYDWH